LSKDVPQNPIYVVAKRVGAARRVQRFAVLSRLRGSVSHKAKRQFGGLLSLCGLSVVAPPRLRLGGQIRRLRRGSELGALARGEVGPAKFPSISARARQRMISEGSPKRKTAQRGSWAVSGSAPHRLGE
jgi:hypothetical protein